MTNEASKGLRYKLKFDPLDNYRFQYTLGFFSYLIVSVSSFKLTKPFAWTPVDLVAVVLAVSFLLALPLILSKPLPPMPSCILVGVFFVALIPGVFADIQLGKVLQIFIVVPIIIVIGYGVGKSPVAIRAVLDSGILVAFLMVLILIVFSVEVTTFGRLLAEGSNPIATGRVIAFGALCALVKFSIFNQRVRSQLVGWFIFAFFFAVLMMIASRGPILALFVALAILAIASPIIRKIALIALLPLAIAGSIGLAFGLDWLRNLPLFVRLLGSGYGGIIYEFSGERAVAAEAALGAMAENPFGIGWGNFSSIPGTDLEYVHNLFLEIGVESGWLGLIAFLALLVHIMFLWVRSDRTPLRWILLSLSSFWFLSAMVSNSFEANRGVWLFLGCLIGYYAVSDRAAKVRNSSFGHGEV